MKISKYSTISFQNDGIETYGEYIDASMPIVPVGNEIVIVELDKATPLSSFTFDLVNEDTGATYELSNSSEVLCVFKLDVPEDVRVGVYRLNIIVRRGGLIIDTLQSQPFRIVCDTPNLVKIKTNNIENTLEDGSPSYYAGVEFYYIQYCFKNAVNFGARENTTLYDDNKGRALMLANNNHDVMILNIDCAEHTAIALFGLLANSYVNVQYYNHDGTKVFANILKVGDIASSYSGNYYQLSSEFLYKFVPVPRKVIPGGTADVSVDGYRVPDWIFCLPYYNLSFWDENLGVEYDNNLHTAEEIMFRFDNNRIPDNFLRTLKNPNLTIKIRNSEMINEIGDNAFPVRVADIYAGFKKIDKLGKNVKLAAKTGPRTYAAYNNVQLNLSPEIKKVDNLKIAKQFFCNDVEVVNDRVGTVQYVAGNIDKVTNSTIGVDVYGIKGINSRCVFEDCEFEANQTFIGQFELINCNQKQNHARAETFDFTNFTGKVVNSFRNIANDLKYKTATTINFEIDENSFLNANSTDNSLNLVLSNQNRRLSTPATTNIFCRINYAVMQQFNIGSNGIITYVNYQNGIATTGTITALSIPNDYDLNLGNFENARFGVAIDFSSRNFKFIDNSFNNISFPPEATVTIAASQLIDIISVRNCFNCPAGLSYIKIVNDLPETFDYSTIITNLTSFQFPALQSVSVSADPTSALIEALKRAYPQYKYD